MIRCNQTEIADPLTREEEEREKKQFILLFSSDNYLLRSDDLFYLNERSVYFLQRQPSVYLFFFFFPRGGENEAICKVLYLPLKAIIISFFLSFSRSFFEQEISDT